MSVPSNFLGGRKATTVRQRVAIGDSAPASQPPSGSVGSAPCVAEHAPSARAAAEAMDSDGLTGRRRLHDLLLQARARGASDLLLIAGQPPSVAVRGEWSGCEHAPLSAEAVRACFEDLLTPVQRDTLERVRDLDLAHAIPGLGRYRINLHYQRGALAAAIRAIPQAVPAFETLGLPEHVLRLAEYPSGLVLVTGGTGQGKSTTLASLINHIHQRRALHVVTIEDPIEYEFGPGKCLIEQRQIGDDSPSFASALRHVLRQRPDVILIGEMRDLETIGTALTAAETGHLVMASLHTASAMQSLSRIIDVFPPAQQPQVRTQVAASLRAIVCQHLVRDHVNEALTPATEILIAATGVRRAIRENETHLLYSMMETGRSAGMHTLEQSLAELVRAGRVTEDEALSAAPEPARMEKLMGRAAAASGDATADLPARPTAGRRA